MLSLIYLKFCMGTVLELGLYDNAKYRIFLSMCENICCKKVMNGLFCMEFD